MLRNKGYDLGLVLAGGGMLLTTERRSIARALSRREFLHCSPTDLQLASLYNGAAAFCFPSLQEGFGLPILEAMAAGARRLYLIFQHSMRWAGMRRIFEFLA